MLREIAIKILKGELPAAAAADVAQERLKLCERCEFFRKLSRLCNLCSCFMDLKAKLLEAECPANKW